MRTSRINGIASCLSGTRLTNVLRLAPIALLICVAGCAVDATTGDGVDPVASLRAPGGSSLDAPQSPSSAPSNPPPPQPPPPAPTCGPESTNGACAGTTCSADTDCASGVCSEDNVCVEAPSCRITSGGDTCGAGEVGDADASQESCCGSVALPGQKVKIDKYEITAGRMREFINQTDGDVQGWVSAHRAETTQIPDSLVSYLPTGLDTPVMPMLQCNQSDGNCDPSDPTQFPQVNQSFGVHDYLGNEVFMRDEPGVDTGQGCWIGTDVGDNGHPTYWWDDDTQTNQYGSQPRAYSQQELDAKSLNCTPEILFAAFCAWDGGRLPTQAELGGANGAWGPALLPWGDGPDFRDTVHGAADPGRIQYGYDATSPCDADAGTPCFLVPAFDGTALNPLAMTLNTTNFNPFPSSPDPYEARYMFPIPADINTNDQAWAVAEPGRMRNDFRFVGPGKTDGYYDLAGNIMEATAPDGNFDDPAHNGWPLAAWVGGSFEGHDILNRGDIERNIFTKYGKQGARCARDS